MSVILLILPDFLLIALGWLLLHRFGFDRHFFTQAEKLVYFVLFPALLFHSITRAPIALGSATVLLAATLGVMLGGIALAWLGRLLVRPDAGAHAATAQCAFRFNSYLALSLATGLGWADAQATMAVILGFAVPISNVGAVHALASRHGGRTLRQLAVNPFILSTLAALACNFFQIPVPQVLGRALEGLGACAIALGLLCVGAALSLQGGRQHAPLIAWMTSAKLLLLPLWTLALAWMMQLPARESAVLLLFSAVPTSSAAHVLAARMGGDGRLVAVTMSLGTLLSAVTLPIWLGLV
ncbi:AEC family transporter [Castellaniella sp.]|uniref:AEC family transporter n=1 Tax=Castellaniella sp. TaxID=1955812 RepID=UPI002AFE673C|nr:AEC family transporter [Castellaniella sp.]